MRTSQGQKTNKKMFYSFCNADNNSKQNIEKVLYQNEFKPKFCKDGFVFHTPTQLTKEEFQKLANDIHLPIERIGPRNIPSTIFDHVTALIQTGAISVDFDSKVSKSDDSKNEIEKLTHELDKMEKKMKTLFPRPIRIKHLIEYCELWNQLKGLLKLNGVQGYFEHGHPSCICNYVIRSTAEPILTKDEFTGPSGK